MAETTETKPRAARASKPRKTGGPRPAGAKIDYDEGALLRTVLAGAKSEASAADIARDLGIPEKLLRQRVTRYRADSRYAALSLPEHFAGDKRKLTDAEIAALAAELAAKPNGKGGGEA